MKISPDILSAENFAVTGTFLLGLCGVLTIASSQSNSAMPLYLVMKQLCFLISGMALLYLGTRIKFTVWQKSAPLLTAAALLLLCLLPLFGSKINGMTGWFRLGPLSFQPSETGRPFFLLTLVILLTKMQDNYMRFLVSGIFILLWIVPVCLQPDFGTAGIYALGSFIICFLAGMSRKFLALQIAPCLFAAAAAAAKYPYVLRRFTGFLSPERDPLGSGWHVRQFELAIARGGWSGSKMGGAVWSNAYLPFSYNDSAGATLLETLGLAGAMMPALLLFILLGSFFVLANRPGLSMQGKLFTAGTAVFIGLQMMIHMGINLALLPPSGLVLPFISYGGSSLAGYCLMTGIVISAAKENRQHGSYA